MANENKNKNITILTKEDIENWEDKGCLRAMVRIQRIVWENEKDNFVIARASVQEIKSGKPFYLDDKYTISIKGHMDTPQIGRTYMLVGYLLANVDGKYDPSYDVYYLGTEISLETSEDKKNFLANILTDFQLQNLYATLPNPFSAIQKGEIDTLVKVKGIGVQTAIKIINRYKDNIAKGALLAFLEKYQVRIGSATLQKLVSFYGTAEKALEKIRENPYQLVEVDGIGWKKADEIALSMGMHPKSLQRYKAFAMYILNYASEKEGSTTWSCGDLMRERAIEALGIENYSLDLAKMALQELADEGQIYLHPSGWFGAMSDYFIESRILKEIKRLQEAPLILKKPEDFEEKLAQVEAKQNFSFNKKQRDAIEQIFANNVLVITGKAGTGKTTVTNGFLNVCDDIVPVLCALSGKAAQRIGEVSGKTASTIHRLLSANQHGLMADVVILDEVSMVNTELFYKLIFAIPSGAKLIIMGDIAQLETIGKGNILRDLTDSDQIPVCTLEEIHRQAAQSGIVTKSLEISEGNKIVPNTFTGTTSFGEKCDFIMDIYKRKHLNYEDNDDFLPVNKILQHWKEEFIKVGKDIKKITVVTPRRNKTILNAYELNQYIQDIYNPRRDPQDQSMYEECVIKKSSQVQKEGKSQQKTEQPMIDPCYQYFRRGDRVMVTKNDYQAIRPDGLSIPDLMSPNCVDYLDYVKPYRAETVVYNGYLGTIEAVNDYGMIVDFDHAGRIYIPYTKFDNIELGYVATVHKYQGSECHTVIFGLDSSANMALSRQMLYTGITRAKEKCILVADIDGFTNAVQVNKVRTKFTFLQLFYAHKNPLPVPEKDEEYEEQVFRRGDFSLQKYKDMNDFLEIKIGSDEKTFIPFDDQFQVLEEEDTGLPF